MKIFENIAEYTAFKKKYELMGDLETERLREVAKDEKSLSKFLQFLNEVLNLPIDEAMKERAREIELQEDIARQKFFLHFPIPPKKK